MKFGKEFIAQMVPEWQDAYMDYNYLKTILKDIKLSHLRNKGNATPRGLSRKSTFYRAFSGLTQRHSSMKHPKTRDVEDPVILVNVVQPEDSEQQYETMFFMSTEEGGENELYFFRRLDDEFNKVDKFYKGKVQEVVKEAEFLNKQMDALIAFRLKVENTARFDRLSAGMTAFASDVPVSASAPNGPRTSAKVHITVPEENQSKEASPTEVGALTHADIYDKTLENSTETKLTSVEILKRVTINAVETPLSTIKGLLKVENERETSFGRENLRRTEEQLKRAFVEFYQKLRLLKNYSFLNLSAFSKIMKKYDKATSRSASRSYLSMVDNSYIGSSDEVTKLIERVENTFIKHFSSSNRSKGMGTLRPKHQRERHRTTFSLGFFTGCAIALLVALVLLIHIRNILKKDGFAQYMENMFPLYSLFGFIFLHMIMYGGNIYFWRRYRINYPFIFGFKQGTELGYRQVFLVSTGLATLALASVLANLDMEMDENTKDFKALTELLPLGLVVLVLVVTFCPLNIIYRSSRVFLLQCVFRCICAPLYKVTLPDFFLADQITSQIQALRSLEFYICYYGWGDFKQRRNTCKSSDVFNTFYFIVATIPYWCRLLQCLRRLYEERDPMQGYNGLKYLSTIVAVLMRTAYSRKGGDAWWALALGTSIIATIFSTYWDLIVDWGLLQRRSKNRWLRDKLILSTKSVYFGVMVLNILLRLAWLQTVLNFKVSFLHRETLIAIVASLEIIRRGIWNFFRLENEHLNNVGKYRAFKSVPLPFNYDENNNDD